jgi:hypothetical protein
MFYELGLSGKLFRENMGGSSIRWYFQEWQAAGFF